MTGGTGTGPDDRDNDLTGGYDGKYDYDRSRSYDRPTDTGFEELGLVDDDDALPWLESDYDEEPEGVDTGRIIGFGLLGLVALVLVMAAIWYLLTDGPDPDLQPQGTTIAAAEGPIKERPDDAGGQTFEGTGNVAPNVGEGRTTESRLAEDPEPEVARSSVDIASSTEPVEDGASAVVSGVPVQVGAYSSRAGATAGWATLRGQTDALNDFKNRIVQGNVDGSVVYRLQAIAGDAAAADRLCNALKDDGIACQVKR